MSKPFRGEQWGCDPVMPIGSIVIVNDTSGGQGLAMVTARGVLTELQKSNHADGGWLLPESFRPPRSEARA